LRGSAGSQQVSIVVCSVPQGAERGRESVNPAKMKLFPGFHNPYASKQTTIALQQFIFLCQEEINSPTSAKASRLRCHAHCGVQSFTSCTEACHDGEETPRRRPAACDVEHPSWRIFPAKERDRGSKKRENGNKYNGKRSSNKQSIHTRKNALESNTNVALTVDTCLANTNGTLQTGRDRKIPGVQP